MSGLTSAGRYETSRSDDISKFTSISKSDTSDGDALSDPDKTEGENSFYEGIKMENKASYSDGESTYYGDHSFMQKEDVYLTHREKSIKKYYKLREVGV